VEHELLLKHDPSGLRSRVHFQFVELIPQAEEVHFPPAVVQYRGLGAPKCQGRDDMTEALVEPSSRISLPPMTNEPRASASRKRRKASNFSFASCKYRRPSYQLLDPTAGDGQGPHNRCVVIAKGLQILLLSLSNVSLHTQELESSIVTCA